MMFPRAWIISLIAIIGAAHSQDLNFLPSLYSLEDVDLEYRPWDRDDTSTIWISLDGMGIGTLNSMFRLNIPNLRWLVLDNNNIERIPAEAFKYFPNLTYISLTKNQIREIHSEAFDLVEKLEALDLDGNPIRGNVAPSAFSSLGGLKRLYLRNCYLSSFDVPPYMENLSHLYLSSNRLDVFYTSDESLLTHLHLDNNVLSYVSLSQFKSLIYLNLSNNKLTKIIRRSEVPPAYYVRNYRQRGYHQRVYGDDSIDDSGLYLDDAAYVLQRLILSGNQLSQIQSDSFEDSEALIHVDLTNNQISEVYAGTFNNLPRLENVLLDGNHIKQINHRAFVNLPNLKIISLKFNRIDDVDEDAFTKLNSSANEVYLLLDNNLIHTLRRGSFRGIKGLKHIGLSNNRIKTISSQTFFNLPNLESIVIENQSRDEGVDPFSYQLGRVRAVPRRGIIESDAFFNLSNLASVTIRGNAFTYIEANAFHELPKLTLLDLSNNSISTISPKAFCDLPSVENLYLGGNQISEIAPGTFPKGLKYLNLASNLVCREFSCWHVGELYRLEKLDVSGMIEQFTIEDFSELPKNLTVIVGRPETPTMNSPVPCY